MFIICLDLEGVLVPEIWIAVAEKTGIDELRLTTRDISDYDELMQKRLTVLRKHNIGLPAIQDIISKIEPMAGAKEFLNELRSLCQIVILSDTFTQFALPLMKKLDMPTLFCNELTLADNGDVIGYRLRQQNGKFHAVCGFQGMGFDIIAVGDSFNDLAMIRQSQAGFLFCAPENILLENSNLPAFTEYNDLLKAIKALIL